MTLISDLHSHTHAPGHMLTCAHTHTFTSYTHTHTQSLTHFTSRQCNIKTGKDYKEVIQRARDSDKAHVEVLKTQHMSRETQRRRPPGLEAGSQRDACTPRLTAAGYKCVLRAEGRGQRASSAVIPQEPPTLLLRWGLSLAWSSPRLGL